ncbi:MAG: hypothetical protein M3471_00520 [Actinomycetota bacterium]|nr:hypothetical protein [Actinomycetota bacterium]
MGKITSGLLVFLMVVLTAACSNTGQRVEAGDGSRDGQGDVDGGDGGTDPPTPSAGGGEDGLFVSVEMGGGFVPIGSAFRSTPNAVVYADGTSLSSGAVAAIYPGPAVLPLTQGRVDDERLRALVTAAAAAGLLDDVEEDYGNPPVADAPTTTVTVVVNGEVHATSVYALGFESRDPSGEGPSGVGFPGVEGPQLDARDRVAEFVDLVSSSVSRAEGDPYVPDRYRVLPLAPGQDPDPVVEADEQPWPFPDVPLVEGECTAITGDRAVEFRDVVEVASEITRWRTDAGQTYALAVRPVLPHEPDCPQR